MIIALGFSAAGARSDSPPAPAAAVASAAGETQYDRVLPVARNLQADGQAATAAKKPILLFFNLSGCPYCRTALRQVLVPMFRSAEWRDRIEFRQVTIDDGDSLIDFDGRRVDDREFARVRKGSFTPTVMMVDGSGQPIGEPIIGIASTDFYGAYVEALATQAVNTMRSRP